MIGIIYSLFSLGVKGGNKVKENIDDTKSREEAKRNGDLTYYAKGGQHLVSNGRLIHKGRNSQGDEVIEDMYNDHVYVNLSEKKRKEIINEALKEGRTVIDKGSHDITNPFYANFKDKWWFGRYDLNVRFIDIKTNRYFRIVCINGYDFYMDIETGLLVRKSDFCINKYKIGNLTEDEIIDLFNKRQHTFKGKEKIIGKPRTSDNENLQKMYYLIYNDSIILDESGKIYTKYWSRYTHKYIVTDITTTEV